MREELYDMVRDAVAQYAKIVYKDLLNKAIIVASKGGTSLEETLEINDENGMYYCFTDWSEACRIGREVCAVLSECGIYNDFYACHAAEKLTLTFKLYWGENADEEFFPYFDDVVEEDDEW